MSHATNAEPKKYRCEVQEPMPELRGGLLLRDHTCRCNYTT